MIYQTKEEQIFFKRIKELAQSAYNKEICTFTDFLTLYEINLFYQIKQELVSVSYSMSGGYPDAERKLICFDGRSDVIQPTAKAEELPPDFYYPISCLKIYPTAAKFAEVLSHRDYLGAVVNLGLDRSKLGDLILKENEAFLFCKSQVADFLLEQLEWVRHTKVTVVQFLVQQVSFERNYEVIHTTVSSIRLDAVIAAAFHHSRSKMVSLITQGNVYINGALVTNVSHVLKQEDIISVRGYGKVKVGEQGNLSKKGRINITLLKYS